MAWVALSAGAQSVATGFTNVYGNLDLLRSAFIGTSAPAAPVEGQFWLDTSATPYVLKIRADFDGGGVAWNEVLVGTDISSNVTMSYNEFLEMCVANLGAHATVSAGRDGHIYYLTSDGELYFVDQAVDAATKKICSVQSGTTTGRVPLPMSSVGVDATNPPTLKTKGTTPTVRGWEFDAANELYSWNIRVPSNFSADGDLTLRLDCVLDQAETAADDIDWSADVLSLADGESATGTSTAAAASLTDIGSNNAEGEVIRCDITIDYDDATNPVVAGDLLIIEIHRTDLAEVGGVIVTHAELVYPVNGAIQ